MPASRVARFGPVRILVLSLIASIASFGTVHAEWEAVKEGNGVSVYTQTVPGSDVKAFKGMTRIQTSVASLLAVLADTSAYPNWMHNCTEGKLLKEVSTTEQYVYFVNDFPWPTTDRDLIFHARTVEDPDTGTTTVHLEARPDYSPNTDYIRVPKGQGFYLFEPQPDGYVQITWQMHMEMGGSVPAWVLNTALVDLPFQSLQNLQRVVRLEKYQQAASS